MNAPTYIEKLQDPRWQKKRLQIFERDHYTCQNCESKSKQLQVHHRRYLKGKEPWEVPDEFLVTLCKDCHELATETENRIRDFFTCGTIKDFIEFGGQIKWCQELGHSNESLMGVLQFSLLDPANNSPSKPDTDPYNGKDPFSES